MNKAVFSIHTLLVTVVEFFSCFDVFHFLVLVTFWIRVFFIMLIVYIVCTPQQFKQLISRNTASLKRNHTMKTFKKSKENSILFKYRLQTDFYLPL